MPELNPDLLIRWYQANKRPLPWRDTDDPYKIWISEIMLQQTRVDTVIPYYHRFTETFPTVFDLAKANRQQVLKLWEGLGYYSRGRNLHEAAKTVVAEYNGNIPAGYKEINTLKGIGPYTSAAILSIAFQKKHAVVDGNVIRVITRFLGIEDDIRKTSTKNQVKFFVDETIPEQNPGDFNQALMELGATVCKPANPNCMACPISRHCIAGNSVKTDSIPYKSPAKKVPHYHIVVGLIVDDNANMLVTLRPEDKMLGGLWEFPGGKKEPGESLQEALKRELQEELDVHVTVYKKFKMLKHAYSHFKITLHAFWCRINSGIPKPNSATALRWVSVDDMQKLPFPKANKQVLQDLAQLPAEDILHSVRP